MRRSDSGPLEDLFGQVILSHPRGWSIRRRYQHDHVDKAGDTRITRGDGHDRGRVEQPVLDRVRKINGRNALHRALHGVEIEKIALDHLSAEDT
jgi:hypothetical protein